MPSKIVSMAVVFTLVIGAASAQEMRTATSNLTGPVEVPANPLRVWADDNHTLADVIALGIKPIGGAYWGEAALDHLDTDGIELHQHGDGVSLETIAALDPDLILVAGAWYVTPEDDLQANFWKKERCEALAHIAPTFCFASADGLYVKDNIATLRVIAEALNKASTADAVVAELEEHISSVRKRMEAADVIGSTITVLRVDENYSFKVGGMVMMPLEVGLELDADYRDRRIEMYSGDWSAFDVSLENLDMIDTDYLAIAVDAGVTDTLEALTGNPLYKLLPAVQNKHVFTVPTGYWNSGDIIGLHSRLDDLEKGILLPAEQAN